MVVVEQTSVVQAPVDRVWDRVTTFEGIGDELGPWLTMSVPAGAKDLEVTTVPLGEPLGRSWIRLLGLVPVDYDDLSIVALEPGRSFHERSTMLTARWWEHERTLTPMDEGTTRVHDRLTFEPRALVPAAAHRRVVAALFAHRHRRLAAHFGRGGG